MSRLIFTDVSKSRFGKRVLSAVSLTLHDGQIVALTGENGSGKTTLLDLAADRLPLDPDEGQIQRSAGSTLGYVKQRFEPSEADAFFDESLFLLEQRLRTLEASMAGGDHSRQTLAAYDQALAETDAADAYALRHKLEIFFRAFGLSPSIWSRPLRTLSGGERMRIELATCLIKAPDLLLLDEPTNHLDLAGITFLEDWLKQYKGCCLFVSHDRAFMDAVATDVLRLSGRQIEHVPGNYSHFKAVQASRLDDLQGHIRQQEKAVAREWQITQTMLSHRKISQYHNRRQRAEKMAITLDAMKARAKNRDKTLGLTLAAGIDAGDPSRVVLRLKDVAGGYDDLLFENVSFELKAGEKVALLGPNGCGKTTLFSILNGAFESRGGSLYYAPGLTRASLAQHVRFEHDRRSVYDAVRAFSGDVSETALRSRLAQYGFDDSDLKKSLQVLSGGEAARVAMLRLLAEKPGFLLLDEPTNHLDMYSREQLETELHRYPGTVLFISHDRYFLDAVADRVLGFVGKTVRPFDHYRQWLAAADAFEKEHAAANPQTGRAHSPDSRFGQARESFAGTAGAQVKSKADLRRDAAAKRQQIADLETRIDELEHAIAELEAGLNTGTSPDTYRHYAALTSALDEASNAYLALIE